MIKKRQINEDDNQRISKYQQLDHEPILSPTNLQKCSICNRHFTENRLIDHQRACEQSKKLHFNSSYHYHYDSQLHRWKGLDYHIKTNPSNTKHRKLASRTERFPKTSWREKHQQFQDIVKGQFHLTNDRPYQCAQCQRKFSTENGMIKHQKGCTSKRQIGVKKSRFKK